MKAEVYWTCSKTNLNGEDSEEKRPNKQILLPIPSQQKLRNRSIVRQGLGTGTTQPGHPSEGFEDQGPHDFQKEGSKMVT